MPIVASNPITVPNLDPQFNVRTQDPKIAAVQAYIQQQRQQLALTPPGPRRDALATWITQQEHNAALLQNASAVTAGPPAEDPKFTQAQKWIDEQNAKIATMPAAQQQGARDWLLKQQGNLEMLRNPGAPAFDPALSAFLRSMGVQEQDLRASARQQTQMLQNAYDRQVPVFAESLRAQTEAVQGDAEARGVLASGATALNTQYARNNVLREQEIARGSMVDSQSQVNLDTARQIADIQRRKAEAELEARTRTTQSLAQNAYGQR